MPRDRIKLSDAKALIADGHATPESIAANFDVEDDGAPPTEPTQQPMSRLVAARARVAAKPQSEGSALDYLGAAGKGLMHLVGLPTEVPKTSGEMLSALSAFVPNIYGDIRSGVKMVEGAADAYGRAKAAQSKIRKAQAIVSGVPVISPAAAVAEPAISYAEGTAPTHEQNVSAVEDGTMLAGMLLAPKVIGKVGRVAEARARLRGEVAPVAETPAPATPAPAGDAISASEAANTPAPASSAAEVNSEGAAPGFDAQVYVKEQVAAREAARKAGTPSGVLAKGRSFLANTKALLVDSNAPIEDLLADTIKREKITLQPSRDITNAIDRVYRAPSIAGQFARDNGIEAVIRDVPDLDTLDQYLIAKQAQTVEAGGRATGRDLARDASFVESQALVYEPFAQQVAQYSRNLLDYVTDSGLISPELASSLKETYPDYVPLQRVFSEIENTGAQGAGKSVASLSGQTIVRKLKGSQREIESPIESMMTKTTDAFAQGEKNKAASLLASYRELPGNPFQIEEIPTGEKIPTGAHTFSYRDAGVDRTFRTTKEIAQAAKALNVQQLDLVWRILAAPVRVAKVGITGINPAFLASNIAKDQITGFINSSRGVATLGNPMTFGHALFEALGHGELFDEMIREGALGTSFDMARNQIPSTVAAIRSTRNLATRAAYMTRHPGQFLRTAEDLLARGEEFTRIQHYIAGKAEAVANGLPEEEARIAGARAARENTVNFARRGEWGSVLNSTFLYLNAQIQGTRTLFRSFQARPMATGAKIGTAVFLPVAIATAWNMKDEARRKAYTDIAEFEHQNNIILVPPNPTQDERGRYRVIKIPLSQEINNLTNVPRRLIEQAYGHDPVRAGEIAEALIGTASPFGTSKGQVFSTLTPQFVKPALEVAINKNIFTGREIVPSSPGSRYRKDLATGGTARAIAKQLGISPIQVEEAIRETFGGTGTQALNLVDQTTKVLRGDPKYPVGGESSLEATRRRFGLAFGGEVQRRQKKQADDAKEKALQAMVP